MATKLATANLVASGCLRFPRAKGSADGWPIYGCHEGVDISGGVGAVIDVIGMLVHVEGEDRAV
jgi:hypothetical protein